MFVQVGLAANFQQTRRIALQTLGNGANRADILGDVVADGSVAASRSVTKFTIFIEKRNSDTVDFWLDHNGNFLFWQQSFQSAIEIGDFLFGISVVET